MGVADRHRGLVRHHLQPPEVVAGKGVLIEAVIKVDSAQDNIPIGDRDTENRLEVELLDRIHITQSPVIHRVSGAERFPG